MFASLGRSANFATTSIALGGALGRNDVTATLSEGAEATLNGLYVAGGSQHVDNHTTIDHAKPHGSSRELYKGILDGKAHAVFNGRILVRQDAQKTDSKQTNKNLVLSDDATIDTKPELQIFADDVRCTHGATIGQLDAESLFYLQSRGIGRSDARRLLTYAFAQDVVDRIKVRSLRDSLERILFEKFHERT
jgi:Fe-S cluster assembly protein SufD